MYCKLLTNGKQLPAFPLKAVTGIEPPTSEVGGESVTTRPPWPLMRLIMTNADLIIIVINGPWAVMIHGVPVKTYNALQNHIIVLLIK